MFRGLNVNNTHLFISINEGEINFHQSEAFNHEKEKKGEAEVELTRYLSKGKFRLKAEDIEFPPKRVRVSEAAGREGVSLG